MRFYELTIIFSTTLDEATIQAEVDKVEKQIVNAGGKIEKIERWGVRRMTYHIKGANQGHYVHFLYQAKPGLSSEIERNLRINEGILRYLTVVSPGIVTPKEIKIPDDDILEAEEFPSKQD